MFLIVVVNLLLQLFKVVVYDVVFVSVVVYLYIVVVAVVLVILLKL